MLNQPNSGDIAVDSISTEDLIERCNEERHDYIKEQKGDAEHCYEVYRRAYQDGDNLAMQVVLRDIQEMARYHKYTPLLVSNNYYTLEGLAHEIFIRGKKLLEDFGAFNNYASIRSFLGGRNSIRSVANSVIVNIYIKTIINQPELLDVDDHPVRKDSPSIAVGLENEAFWTIVREICTTEQVILLKLYYVGGLKPRDIAELPHTRWETGQQVSKALFRIHRKLKANNDRFMDFLS